LNLSSLKNRAYFLLGAIIIFYVVIVVISDFNQIFLELNKIKLEYYLIIFPLMFFTIIITSWRFHLILNLLNIKCTFRESFLIFSSGLSLLFTPGTIGTIIRSVVLKNKTGKSISSTAPIIFYEKWLELFSIVFLIGFLLFWFDFIESKIILIIGSVMVALVYFMLKKSF